MTTKIVRRDQRDELAKGETLHVSQLDSFLAPNPRRLRLLLEILHRFLQHGVFVTATSRRASYEAQTNPRQRYDLATSV